MHAFVSADRSPEGLMLTIVAIGAAIIGAALIGWLIAAVAAPVGRVLNRAAPILAVIVFAFTLWVTWRSALEVVNRFVLNHAS
jgi:fucose permease